MARHRDTRSPSPVGSSYSSSKRSRKDEDRPRDERRGHRRSRSPEVRLLSFLTFKAVYSLSAYRDAAVIGTGTEIENHIVGVTDRPEDETTTTMIAATEIPLTGRIEENVRGRGVGLETEMMAGTIAGEAMTEIIGAGEMIPATEREDGGMILLTQNARLSGTIVGIVPRIRIPAESLGRLVLHPTSS